MRAERRAMERQAGKVLGGEVYLVQPGDSWFSIAGHVYGNQRMAGELMEANGGGPLHPGDKILLPPKKKDEVADPYFSKSTWRSAEVLTAQVTGGDVDAVLRAHMEEDIQDFKDGKVSCQAPKVHTSDKRMFGPV